MKINQKEYLVQDLHYTIRSAVEGDANQLSEVRLHIDGETENLDREQGEAFLDEAGFRQIIKEDSESRTSLFLVAVSSGRILGYSRCEGNKLKRFHHKVEFGICILKDYWGFGIGTNLLKESTQWADLNGIKKIALNVLETNNHAIKLYKKYGFEVEGTLKNDKYLSDGRYYNTIVMGRFNGLEL